jgi:hypothetical protein
MGSLLVLRNGIRGVISEIHPRLRLSYSEILGDRCFEKCGDLATVTFENGSNLMKIGERGFAFSAIRAITIRASTNEIDGSASAGGPLEAIDIAPGNRRFMIRESNLLTSEGTEIVRDFGLEREIFVRNEVEVRHKSCCESLEHLTELSIESGSKLMRIRRSAFSGCESLINIVVPASVSEIEE